MLREEKLPENASFGVENTESRVSELDSAQNMVNPDDDEEKLPENASLGVENTESRVSEPDSGQNMVNPDDKMGFSGKDLDLFRDSVDGSQSKPSNLTSEMMKTPKSGEKIGFCENSIDFMRDTVVDRVGYQSKGENSICRELTLSYLCDNPKNSRGFLENQIGTRNLKGKEVILEDLRQEEKWVERDFLQLNDSEGGTSKRGAQEDANRERDNSKKPKIETQTLRLSLALPDVSLSLSASNAAPPNCDAKPSRSVQSLGISNNSNTNNNNNNNNNNTHVTCSDDFTAASLSYSYSHPFSHNPSCSLTRNSTEYYENSVGSRRRETDQIWNGGEETNGSVHSRFKPIGDGVSLSNPGSGVVYSLLNRPRPVNRENSFYTAAASDTSSFFPSELPAKPRTDVLAVDSMAKSLDHFKGLDSLDNVRGQKNSKGQRVVRDVITEYLKLSRDLPVEAVEAAKEYMKYLMEAPEGKEELVDLQNLLERRSDLTRDALSKCDRAQLEVLVAVKFGLSEFISGKVRLPSSELVEIFLYMRCRNVNCKSSLPVDDCDCKICSTKKGFCSQCMCSVCYNYDCANNTCSWVGCDACSHWCHAACGAEKNLIRPGPSLKGQSSGTTEMQFYCLGCGHASEMFGFVKDVFICCAKDWGLETLIKELDCVRRIFKGSEDLKGKELYLKAAELITRLERRAISPSDACSVITHFFTTKSDKNDMAEYPAASIGAKDATNAFPPSTSNLPPKSSFYNSTAMHKDSMSYDFHLNTSPPKPRILSDRHLQDESSGKYSKKDGFDSLDSIVRIKKEESRMLQNRADEARKEVEVYQKLMQERTEKLEEEYAEKLAKLCLQETEEKRRKKLEELRLLESSHSDYYKMKIRMQAEISGLIERMEATKQLWV